MTNTEPGLLPEEQQAIIKSLAEGFSKRGVGAPVFDREDCFQVGFVAVWELARDRGAALHDAEVYLVAKHAVLTAFRGSWADDRRRRSLRTDPSRVSIGGDPFAADLLDGRDAFRSLSDGERDVVYRRIWMSQTNVEIGDSTGLSVNVVANRLKSAFAKIRTSLGDAYADEYARKHARKYSIRRIKGPRWVPSVDRRRSKVLNLKTASPSAAVAP